MPSHQGGSTAATASEPVGFFFSLGHSTNVLGLSIGIAVAASAATSFRDSFQGTGGIIKMWRQAKRGEYRAEELDQLLASRGL
ncbi:MAG: hypothetical protein ACRDRI_01060 [Pseudonocardiaceae bacterium]